METSALCVWLASQRTLEGRSGALENALRKRIRLVFVPMTNKLKRFLLGTLVWDSM